MTRPVFRIGAAIALVTIAAVASAATTAQVSADASALLADYQALEVRVDACPGGACSDAHDIIVAYAALEVRRAQLHADRATLPANCGCEALDATIASIDALSGVLFGKLGGWEQEG